MVGQTNDRSILTCSRNFLQLFAAMYRLGSRYRSGRSPDWLKFKNPEAPAVRELEENWSRR
jgi:hypothetical protein